MGDVTALIPFRKGSKGIVDKNTRILDGMELWRRTLGVAIGAGIGRIVLATDYPDAMFTDVLADGIELWQRQGMRNTHDDASTDMVVREWLEAHADVSGTVILMQVTNQFVTPQDIARAVSVYDCGTLISAVRCEHIIWISNRGELMHTEFVRRQDMPTQWIENGAFHVFDGDDVRRTGTRYNPPYKFYPMGQDSLHDIDSADDWTIVQKLIGG